MPLSRSGGDEQRAPPLLRRRADGGRPDGAGDRGQPAYCVHDVVAAIAELAPNEFFEIGKNYKIIDGFHTSITDDFETNIPNIPTDQNQTASHLP